MIAVEGELERRAGEPDLEAGAVAASARRRNRSKLMRGVDRLAVPGEAAGGGEALGDRRPGQREFDVGERLDDARAASSRTTMVPSLDADFRERRGAARRARLGRARARAPRSWPDQFELPSGVEDDVDASAAPATRRRSRCGRPAAGRSAAARPACSAVSAGRRRRSSPRLTSSKLTVPVGNSDTVTAPRSTGSSPVTARISALTASRTAVRRDQKRQQSRARRSRRHAKATTASPRRLMPVAAVTDASFSNVSALKPGRLYRAGHAAATWTAFCDPFVAGAWCYRRISMRFRRSKSTCRSIQRVGDLVARLGLAA